MAKSTSTGKKVLVRQVRSAIGRPKSDRKRLQCLGLGRIGNEREFQLNPALLGMLKSMNHILEVKEKT